MSAQDSAPEHKDTPAKPATTPPSATEPQDLHIPEELPPPMPEQADKPAQPANPDATPGTNAPVTTGEESIPSQPAKDSPSETEPQDLHIPEELPPPMPDLADKPDKPAQQEPAE